MATFAAWVLLPIALLIAAGGAGLLAEAVARAKLPDGLVIPVGAWVLVLLGMPFYMLGLGALWAALTCAIVAIAGYVVARARPLRPLRTPAAISALLVYVLYLAPVLLTGHWTWTGYNFVNDPSVNVLMIDHIAEHGKTLATGPRSTANAMIQNSLGGSYPIGAHGLLATLHWFVPVKVVAAYQPFVACLAGLAAMALTELARMCRLPAAAAIGAAVLALGAGLAYNFGLHGGIKELAVIGCVATAAALGRAALDARLHVGTVALIGLPLAAALAVISAAAAAYAGMLAIVLLLAALLGETRPSARTIGLAALAAAGVLVVATLPFLSDTISFGQGAATQFGSGTTDGPSVLGHLVRPLPIYQALGTWLRDDYRYPLEPGSFHTLTVGGLVITALLVLVAVVTELRSRRWGAILVVVPALAVALFTASRLSPYGQSKILVILSPMAVFAAALGAWWLIRHVRVVGYVAAAALAAGILGTDALAYHYTQRAPTDRIEALDDALDHLGPGEWMLPEWEEYAKYLSRGKDLDVAPEGFADIPELRTPGPIFNLSFDPDELTLPWVERFNGLLLRRSPTLSRPPANYERIYENRFYELWQKDPDGPQVLDHLPLGGESTSATRPSCGAVEAMADDLRPGERLVASPVREQPMLDVLRDRPNGWHPTGGIPDVLTPDAPGLIGQDVSFAGGRYRVWVRGSSERTLTVTVDGREVGQAQGVNTPGQYLDAGTVEVGKGRHKVTLERPGGNFAPGDGYRGVIGRVLFEPVGAEADLVSVSARDADSLCGRAWDWIERVRP